MDGSTDGPSEGSTKGSIEGSIEGSTAGVEVLDSFTPSPRHIGHELRPVVSH